MKIISYETAAVLNLGSVDRYQEFRKFGLEKNYEFYFENPISAQLVSFVIQYIHIYIYIS